MGRYRTLLVIEPPYRSCFGKLKPKVEGLHKRREFRQFLLDRALLSGTSPDMRDGSDGGAALITASTPTVFACGAGSGARSAVPTSAPTLEDVARVAGVSRATVSRFVNGKRQ